MPKVNENPGPRCRDTSEKCRIHFCGQTSDGLEHLDIGIAEDSEWQLSAIGPTAE